MLSHDEDDIDAETEISSKCASSSERYFYGRSNKKVVTSRQEKGKETEKDTDARAKRSLFKALKNKNFSC
jgi:hypothetical protein